MTGAHALQGLVGSRVGGQFSRWVVQMDVVTARVMQAIMWLLLAWLVFAVILSALGMLFGLRV